MQAEIIIFILTCLTVASGLVFATYWLTRARWQKRWDSAVQAQRRQDQTAANNLDKSVQEAQRKLDEAVAKQADISWLEGIKRGKSILAGEISKAHDQQEVLGLALAVSHRGRVRVRIVDGDGGHHLLLHSPAGYKNKARASEILERIVQARLVRVEDLTPQ